MLQKGKRPRSEERIDLSAPEPTPEDLESQDEEFRRWQATVAMIKDMIERGELPPHSSPSPSDSDSEHDAQSEQAAMGKGKGEEHAQAKGESGKAQGKSKEGMGEGKGKWVWIPAGGIPDGVSEEVSKGKGASFVKGKVKGAAEFIREALTYEGVTTMAAEYEATLKGGKGKDTSWSHEGHESPGPRKT